MEETSSRDSKRFKVIVASNKCRSLLTMSGAARLMTLGNNKGTEIRIPNTFSRHKRLFVCSIDYLGPVYIGKVICKDYLPERELSFMTIKNMIHVYEEYTVECV